MSLTTWSLVTPAFDPAGVFTGDLRGAGIHEAAGICVVAGLFDLRVTGWSLYLYMYFFERLARTPPSVGCSSFNRQP